VFFVRFALLSKQTKCQRERKKERKREEEHAREKSKRGKKKQAKSRDENFVKSEDSRELASEMRDGDCARKKSAIKRSGFKKRF